MKRICLYGSSANLGGTEMYMITIVRALKNKIVFDYLIHHACGKIPFEDEIVSLGGKIYREYYFNSERKNKDYISPQKIIESHAEWDGIYINVQRIHTAYRLLRVAKKAKLPFRIIHAHNNNYTSAISFKDKLYEKYFQFTKKSTITHYLACSKGAGEWMFGQNINTIVIPNAIDFKKFQIDEFVRDYMRKKYEICNETVIVGFCGRLCYQKNPEFLIDILISIKTIPQCKLLVIGDGELLEVMKSRVIKEKIEEKVIFAGATDNVQDYYQMMDCFVLPSRFEGFGIVLLEAQAAGLRCYTTDKVVPYETNVTGRVTFISEKNSAEEWAEQIVEGGFDRVSCLEKLEKSDYSLSNMQKKLLNLFGLCDSEG